MGLFRVHLSPLSSEHLHLYAQFDQAEAILLHPRPHSISFHSVYFQQSRCDGQLGDTFCSTDAIKESNPWAIPACPMG